MTFVAETSIPPRDPQILSRRGGGGGRTRASPARAGTGGMVAQGLP